MSTIASILTSPFRYMASRDSNDEDDAPIHQRRSTEPGPSPLQQRELDVYHQAESFDIGSTMLESETVTKEDGEKMDRAWQQSLLVAEEEQSKSSASDDKGKGKAVIYDISSTPAPQEIDSRAARIIAAQKSKGTGARASSSTSTLPRKPEVSSVTEKEVGVGLTLEAEKRIEATTSRLANLLKLKSEVQSVKQPEQGDGWSKVAQHSVPTDALAHEMKAITKRLDNLEDLMKREVIAINARIEKANLDMITRLEKMVDTLLGQDERVEEMKSTHSVVVAQTTPLLSLTTSAQTSVSAPSKTKLLKAPRKLTPKQ